MPKERIINLGFGNFVVASRVVGIINPASSPMRRLREDARTEGRLVDATQGHIGSTIYAGGGQCLIRR